jgi:mono/diheme cytochrome c family protein
VLLALNGYEIGLLAVALVFIAFALVVALVVPRRRPGFPANRLGVFIAVCVALFLVQMGAVLAMTELGGDEHAAEAEPTETTPTETEPTETEPAGSTALGKEIFLANCAACHTLADAGTTGTVGPNLDASAPSFELAVDRVTNGRGAMPAFSGTLSEEEIAEVATYVSAVAG